MGVGLQLCSEEYFDCGMYTCLFDECISNEVFDMGHIDIDVKYHQRYATIPWQYGRRKNVDDTISENKVTGIVTRKIDGSSIAKEHDLDTTNYSTPRPKRSVVR
ncbi:hypothetical protein H5410_030695 [Solanum commersonii]|uniref:Uncharacterized protein n=1 Tax=Solanum commersonii TaxID=4109 RepID=A0A9J5YGY2_SOLCO|nr:hypothetical protein H5410_030695 [Solanum commersonii]